ncbi:MAG: hypothetical protein K8F91_19285, partial [Candidatus Obscuribacterales bacterium]|nr:hypothetical protein [Candidatus Obscuribacterales bacterium]
EVLQQSRRKDLPTSLKGLLFLLSDLTSLVFLRACSIHQMIGLLSGTIELCATGISRIWRAYSTLAGILGLGR